MYVVSEWKSTSPAFIYLTSIALYSEMSAMKVSSASSFYYVRNYLCND